MQRFCLPLDIFSQGRSIDLELVGQKDESRFPMYRLQIRRADEYVSGVKRLKKM